MRWILLLLIGMLCFGTASCIDADTDDGTPDTLIIEDTPDNNTTVIENNEPPADIDVNVDAGDGL